MLLGILALASALRLFGLGDAWLNPDEGIYYSMTAWRDSAKFWEELAANAHPPLYYLILRGIAGFTPDFWYYRLFSVGSGVLAVLATWWLARALWASRGDPGGDRAEAGLGERPEERDAAALGRACALVAALGVAVAPGHIEISQILRPYAFLTLTLACACASAVAFVRGAGAWSLLVYVLAIATALLTHYSAFLVAPALAWLALHALLRGALRGRRLALFAVAQIVPVAIVAGLYFLHLRPRLVDSALADQALAEGGWLTPFLIDSLGGVWTHTLGVLGFASGTGAEVMVGFLFVLGVALLVAQRRWRALGLVAATWAVAVGLSAIGKYPFGASRHSSWTLVFFALPVAYACRPLLARRVFVAPLALALLAVPSYVFAGSLRRALRFGQAPQVVAGEKPLPRASVSRFVSSVLPRIENERGHVVMDMQTYYSLLPFYTRAREAATYHSGTSADAAAGQTAMFFSWGKHRVSVAWRWNFSVLAQDAGKPRHILEVIRAHDKDKAPGERLAEQEEVLLVWAGWPASSFANLAAVDAQRPDDERWIRSAVVADGLRVYRFRMKSFVDTIRGR